MRLLDLPPLRASRHWLQENRLFWQQALVVSVVLFSSLVLIARIPGRLIFLLIGLPVAFVGVRLLLRWPPLGLLLLIVVATFFPSEIIHNIGVTALFVIGLTGIWFFDMLVVKRQITFVTTPTLPPLLLFLGVTILAFLNGQLPWYPTQPAPLDAQLGGILILAVVTCAFLLVANQVKDERWLKAMVFLLLGIGAVYMFLRVLPVPGARVLLGRIFTFYVHSGSMFWTWIVAMAASQALFNQRLARHWRALLGVVLVITFYLALGEARGWVSGWFPALLAFLVILWLGAPRQALMLALLGTAVLLTQMDNIVENLIYVDDNEYSQMTRLEAWRIIGEIVKVSPILGLGPANYSYYTQLFPILGWYVQFNSHNNYVDIVAQTGLLGLVFTIWFIVEIVRLAWRLYQVTPRGGFLFAFVIGSFGGLVATFASGLLGDWFLPYVYNATIRSLRTSILPWLFMGGLVAVEQILRARNNGQLPPVYDPSSRDDGLLTIDD